MENTFTNIEFKMSKNIFSTIPSIISDAKKGKMFILVDDKNRENEGDLVVAGSNVIQKLLTLWLNMVEA